MQKKLIRLIRFGIFLCILLTTMGIALAESVGVYDNAGTWALWNPDTNSADIVGFGWAGTEPLVGDWDGDGVTEVGIYNRAGNNFLIMRDTMNYHIFGLGWAGVSPVVGDWNGDMDTDIGVYDNAGTWALWDINISSDEALEVVIGFGWAGTEPIVGDWGSDGEEKIGLYNRNGNNFMLMKGGGFEALGLGWTGVTPLVGDWEVRNS